MSANKDSDKDDTQSSVLSGSVEEKIVYENSLPEKSSQKYNSCYNKFIEWKNEAEVEQLSEDVILKYFIEMSHTKKPSTLLSTYSMLKQTILANDNIDISDYRKLHLFLKKKSFNYQCQKPKIFTTKDIERFLNDAPDRKYLVAKVAFILGIAGACRSDELCNITIKDIEDNGTSVQLKIRNPDTNIERTFNVSDGFYKIYRKYADLRPDDPKTDRFFMKYNDGKCTRQVIGIHKFGGMPRVIASWLQLPEAEAYTGHSFRLTSATLLAGSGDDIMTLGRHVGLAFSDDNESTQKSSVKKQNISEQITGSATSNPWTTTSTSSTPSTSSASNFEAIYLPLKEDCDDRNSASISRESNPFMENDKSESRKLRQMKQSDQSSSGRSLKAVNPLGLRSPTMTPPPTSVIRQQASPKTLVLNTTPLKIKQVVPMTSKMPSKQPQANRVPQNGVPHQTAEVCLRWNSYQSNMQNSFPSLLDSEEFVDVTLACEGKSVKCHKIILCSCSDYLAQLLRENPCPHPIILMKDLKFWEVEALVKFMYKGEVNVPHDKLPQFLNAARALQVKGLTNSAPPNTTKLPPLIPQSKPQPSMPTVLSNPADAKDKSSRLNSSSTTQSNDNRGTKRPHEATEPQPFIRIRLQRPKSNTRPESPVIKSEPLDATPSPADTFLQINDNNLIQNDENDIIMHERDDPGGDEQSDYDDLQFETHGSGDINVSDEKIELVPTDFFQQNILDKSDHESSRSSIVEIAETHKRPEEPDDGIDDAESSEKDET